MSNRLLNTLLIPSTNILKTKYSQHWLKPLIHLIDLLNKSFTECHSTLLKDDGLILLTDVLLSLVEEESLLIKSSIHLLIKLINKYENILKYVQQKQEFLYKLIYIENQVYLIIASISNDDQIKIMINNDQNFDLVLREYIKQENDLLSKRLKCKLMFLTIGFD